MTISNKNSYIYKSDGDILSEVSLTSTKNNTQVVDLPADLKNEIEKNTQNPFQSSTYFASYIPNDINLVSGDINGNILNEKYEYSYNQIQEIITKQLEEKLSNFLEETEMLKTQTKSEIEHFNGQLEEKLNDFSEKHKKEVTSELGHFGTLLDRLLGYKQAGKSNIIGITVGIGGIIIAIMIGFMAPVITGYFNNTSELMTEKQIMKKDIEIINDHLKEVSNKVDKIEANIEDKKKLQNSEK